MIAADLDLDALASDVLAAFTRADEAGLDVRDGLVVVIAAALAAERPDVAAWLAWTAAQPEVLA